MENHREKLTEALAKLSTYEPDQTVWVNLDQQLNEIPLHHAVKRLGEYEPDELLWESIESKTSREKRKYNWWYAAAMLLIASGLALWASGGKKESYVSFSEESIDARLQVNAEQATDNQYEQLKAYCESETLVCSSKNFKRLTQEYEELRSAALKVQQAMGNYNTEPELMRQYSILEQEKAEVLNEMAKMI